MAQQAQLGLFPEDNVVTPPQAEPLGQAVEARSTQILLEMFGIIQKETGQDARSCWNQLVRFLADCARVHPMPAEDRPVADRLVPLALSFFTPFYDARDQQGYLPWDPLGQVFTQVDIGEDSLGQNLTPRWIVEYINSEVIGGLTQEDENEEELESRLLASHGRNFLCVLDPCVGTGRFLLDVVERYCPRFKIALFGVEKDLDLYRACLVNMRLWGANVLCPYFIIRADALLCDLKLDSPSWQWANQWTPPDWETTFRMSMPGTAAEEREQGKTPITAGMTWQEYQKWKTGETEGIDWQAVQERARPSFFVPTFASAYFPLDVARPG